MSAEGPKKNPIDRLFEKPATKFDSPVQQALYDHAIAEEAEILRLRKAAVEALAAWEPPTNEQFCNWFTPDDAVEGLTGRLEDGPKKRWLLERLRAGAIIGVARQSQARGMTSSFTRVPPRAWEFLDDDDPQFWEFGDVSVIIQHPSQPTGRGGQTSPTAHRERYLEVRFHPDDFSGGHRPRVVPPPTDTADPAREEGQQQAITNKGGRPAKPFWEDLLVEMFDQLWHGRLMPQTQADIEKAMDSWLIANGHEASERSIRERAKKLWKAWIKESNN